MILLYVCASKSVVRIREFETMLDGLYISVCMLFFLNVQFSSHFFWLKETSNPKLVPCVGVNVHVLDL